MKSEIERISQADGHVGLLRLNFEDERERKIAHDIVEKITSLAHDLDLGRYTLKVLGYEQSNNQVSHITAVINYGSKRTN